MTPGQKLDFKFNIEICRKMKLMGLILSTMEQNIIIDHYYLMFIDNSSSKINNHPKYVHIEDKIHDQKFMRTQSN